MKPRVIILEDDESSRTLLRLLLEERGFEVLAFADPTICPIYTDSHSACTHDDACGDFLLTDNRMPGMSGLDFVAEQTRRGCKGIIRNKAVMSATWSDEELSRAEDMGCKVFKKPYQVSEIIEWLELQSRKLDPDRKLAVLL